MPLPDPASWPPVARSVVLVGGVTVTYADAEAASGLLALSRTSAIAPVLRAAGSPLAACDYLAAAAPYLKAARDAPKTGRAGAAGRHVTKNAFCAAIAAALARACRAYDAMALAAFASDERYAAQIAADAVELKRREHAASVRRNAEGEISRAIAACGLTGEPCGLDTPCGTGKCAFAPGWLAEVRVPAVPGGRLHRPSPHIDAGAAFSAAGAISEVVADASARFRPQVSIRDADRAAARDLTAADAA